jgi:centrosomal protein CEP104
LKQCHINKTNLYNQVGIVALNVLGVEVAEEKSINSSEVSAKPSRKKESGPPSTSLNDLLVDLNLDPHTASILRALSDAKTHAVQTEDYLTAKQIKNVEGDIREMGARMAELDIAKREAVVNEDYDRAAMLKSQTDELRQDIQQKVQLVTVIVLI